MEPLEPALLVARLVLSKDTRIVGLARRREMIEGSYLKCVEFLWFFVETPRRGVSTPLGAGCLIHISIRRPIEEARQFVGGGGDGLGSAEAGAHTPVEVA